MSSDTAVVTESPVAPTSKREWVPDLAVVIATTAASTAITVLFFHRFFFVDDTQASTIGTWWTLGSRVRSGDFSYLDLTTWTSGNVLVEGQWAVFNPVIVLISVVATFVSSLVFYALAVKLAFLCFAGCGMYFLAKELGSGRRTAVIVGCLLPLTGFTTYMDAASWTTGLMAFSAFPWLWLSLVRLRRGAWGLLPAAGFVAFIITVGYFHPALMAGLLIGAFLLVALWERDWEQVVNMVIVGAVLVLLFIPVFAPALLTADVTNRGSNSISSTGFWGPDASDLLTAGSIAPGAEIPNWRGATIPVPIFYIAWFLPVLAAGITRRYRTRDIAVAAVFGLLVLLLLMGPTEIGPLRFPARLLPYWSLAVLVALVVAARDGQVQSLRAMTPMRRFVMLAWLPIVGTFAAFSDTPSLVVQQAVGLIAVLAALLGWYALAARRAKHAGQVVSFAMVTLAVVAVMHWASPHPPVDDFGVPGEVSRLQTQLDGLEGQTFIVGNMENAPLPQLWESSLLARSWAVNPMPVQNSYTVIGYAAYTDDLLMNYHGLTPGATLDRLFATDPTTGQPLVDLMAIDNVQIWRHSVSEQDLGTPPSGWTVANSDQYTLTWTRDTAAQALGAPTWTSPGVTAEVVENNNDSVELLVDNPGEADGQVVLSRLAWPGYGVQGPAGLADPLRGYLLRVTIPPNTNNATIKVSFTTPGLMLGYGTAAVAVILLAVAEVIRRRSRKPRVEDDRDQCLPSGAATP